MNAAEWNFTALTNWLLANGLRILIVLAATWLLTAIARKSINSLARRMIERAAQKDQIEVQKRIQTLASLGGTVVSLTILGVAATVVLGQLGINLGPILTAAGILGLAVGFGAQSLVKDVITGLFILMENQFNIGDVISAGGVSGVVERSNLRVTVLRDPEGTVHFVPNGQISTLSNMTKEWSRAVLDIGVAYKEDTDAVAGILKRIGEEMQADPDFGAKILEPMQVLGINDFADSAVMIRVSIKTRPIEQWAIAREFRRRVKKAFDQAGVEIPFPHMTLYMGEAASSGRLKVEMARSGETVA